MSENRTTAPLTLLGVALAFLGVFPLAAFIKWAPVVQWLPRAGAEWAISIVVVLAACLALARYAGERVDNLLANVRDAVLSATPRDFAIYAGLFTFLGSVAVAWFCFGRQPTGGDEMAQLFQSRIMMAGRLWAVAEQPFESFSGIQTVNMNGRWFAQFPVGHPSLLALGGLVGASWVINPLLAGWTAVNVYRFASRITDETTARLATILFATSPFVLLMSASLMNHASALAFMMYGLVALVDWERATDSRAARAAALRVGFGFAVSATIRPYEAAVFGLVVGVFQLVHARRSVLHARSFAWQIAGGALPMAFLLYANAQQTGSALLFGYDALNGASHQPGFHVDPTGVDFTPIQGVHHISSYLLLLNTSLFGGPIPSVILVVTALLLATRATQWDHLTVVLVGALLVAYGSYWAESFFVGPRFLYTAVPFLVIIVASLPRVLAAVTRTPIQARASRLLLPVSLACAWLLPPGVAQFQGVWGQFVGDPRASATAYFDLDREVREEGLDGALVIVHESWHGRMTARLRALGAPALRAESMLREFDACGLQVGLDAEERVGGPPGAERVQRVARRALMFGEPLRMAGTNGSTTLALSPNRPLHPYCAAELGVDRAGSAPLDWFLANARFDRDGHLSGRVVYARDFGAANNRLLGRFGDRTWYRYRPRTGPSDHAPVFTPYLWR